MNDIAIIPYGTDNLAYAIGGGPNGACLVIDPGEASAVLAELRCRGWTPEALLATHGHADHVGGAAEVARRTGCPPLTMSRARTEWTWSGGQLQVIAVPGHTADHVAFYDPDRQALFTGDTLFVAGCGRLFGCVAETLWNSLQRLTALPAGTRVYPGHDYALDNLAFAAQLTGPPDSVVADKLERVRAGAATIPSTLAEERRTNSFLRCADPDFRRALDMEAMTPAAVFAELRRRKDVWL